MVMMHHPQVTIIILNWNGWEDTLECMESVFKINYSNFNIIVVDNASEDDSIEKIKDYCSGKLKVESSFFNYDYKNKPIPIYEYDNPNSQDNIAIDKSETNQLILIKNDKNYGFPGGNNTGIKFALKHLNPEYILLLNNDTVVEENFLDELIRKGESKEDIGILGPKIYYYDEPNTIWSAGCKISWKLSRGIQIGTGEPDKGQYDMEREVEYVSGSAFLIKTQVIEKIGLMDEKYFIYFEESDWTLRANIEGYKSLYIPKSNIWHKVSRSGGGISKPVGLYYITRNRWIFMKKWAKRSDYWIFIIYQLLGALIFPLGLSVYYGNPKLFGVYYRGLEDGINSY